MSKAENYVIVNMDQINFAILTSGVKTYASHEVRFTVNHVMLFGSDVLLPFVRCCEKSGVGYVVMLGFALCTCSSPIRRWPDLTSGVGEMWFAGGRLPCARPCY